VSVTRQHKTGGKRKRSPVRIAHRFGEEDFQKLVEAINKGLTIQMAARATGFARSVVYDYLARNPNKQDALKRQCEVSWLSRLDSLARSSGDWRAYAWLLERNFPHSYALFTVQRHQISGSMKLNEKVQMVPESELIEMHQAAAEVAAQAPRFKAKLNGQN
jgi:hypothetical protein